MTPFLYVVAVNLCQLFSLTFASESPFSNYKILLEEKFLVACDINGNRLVTLSKVRNEGAAALYARLSHPRIPTFYNIVRKESIQGSSSSLASSSTSLLSTKSTKTSIYVAREFIPGNTLALTHGLLPVDIIALIASQLLSVIHYLHVNGIAHGRIDTDHIIISPDFMKVYLIGFGGADDVDAANIADYERMSFMSSDYNDLATVLEALLNGRTHPELGKLVKRLRASNLFDVWKVCFTQYASLQKLKIFKKFGIKLDVYDKDGHLRLREDSHNLISRETSVINMDCKNMGQAQVQWMLALPLHSLSDLRLNASEERDAPDVDSVEGFCLIA